MYLHGVPVKGFTWLVLKQRATAKTKNGRQTEAAPPPPTRPRRDLMKRAFKPFITSRGGTSRIILTAGHGGAVKKRDGFIFPARTAGSTTADAGTIKLQGMIRDGLRQRGIDPAYVTLRVARKFIDVNRESGDEDEPFAPDVLTKSMRLTLRDAVQNHRTIGEPRKGRREEYGRCRGNDSREINIRGYTAINMQHRRISSDSERDSQRISSTNSAADSRSF